MAFRDTLGLLTAYFGESVSTKSVVGEPMIFGEVTLIPVATVTCGIGGGGGEGNVADKDKSDVGGAGEGIGGGYRVTPIAIISIKDSDVKVLPVQSKGSLFDKLFENMPKLVEMAQKGSKGKDDGAKADACQEC